MTASAPIGLVDISNRGRLALTGRDRVRFLQGMLTCDVAKLGVGESHRAAVLTPKGRVVADLYILAEAERLVIDTDPALAEKLKTALEHYIVMDDVTVASLQTETASRGLYGKAALLADLPSDLISRDLSVIRTPLGFHVFGSPELLARSEAQWLARATPKIAPMSAEQAEVFRIEQGVSRYGAEISEDVLPIEVGLDDAISYTKGCYIGQEPIARVASRGHINRKVVGFLPHAPVAPGSKISAPDRPEAGTITSSTSSSRLGRPIALGLLHRSLWEPGTKVAIVAEEGTTIEASVSALPFP